MTQRIVDLARRLGTRTYRRVFRRDLERDFQRLDHSDTALRSAMEMEQKMRCASALLAIPGLHERVTPPVLKAGDWLHEELFVFGSGASLLDLTAQERKLLSKLPVLTMNKNLLYWDVLGIWPTYTYLADTHFPASEVFTRMVETLVTAPERRLPGFILRDDYRPWPLTALQPLYFKRHSVSGNHPWAESLDDKMYFHRGSLSCLLNLITALKFAPKVTLLGVDLDDGAPFYQERYGTDTTLHDVWEAIRQSTGVHPTALEHEGVPPIQAKLPWIFEQMAARGVTVSCYSAKSLPAKLGLCPLRAPLA